MFSDSDIVSIAAILQRHEKGPMQVIKNSCNDLLTVEWSSEYATGNTYLLVTVDAVSVCLSKYLFTSPGSECLLEVVAALKRLAESSERALDISVAKDLPSIIG